MTAQTEARASLWAPATADQSVSGWTYDFDQIERISRAAYNSTGYDATMEVVQFVMAEADRRYTTALAAALQAERDAAAPKLPDDLAGLVERLEEPGAVCWSDVTDARTTIQSLVARNAELEAGIRGIAEGNLGDEPGQANYARIKSVACSLLNKDRQP